MSEGFTPSIALVASPHSRTGAQSPFLRFVRDYSHVLKRFTLHCTGGTAKALTSTGIYAKDEVTAHPSGSAGGLVELAAMTARDAFVAVLLIIDPADMTHDEPLIKVLKRIADQRGTRLVITLGDAVRWALFEALDEVGDPDTIVKASESPLLERRTLALRAHDNAKEHLIRFVAENDDLVEGHGRVLATGCTGWILKLLFAVPKQQQDYVSQMAEEGVIEQVSRSINILLGIKGESASGVAKRVDELRKKFHLTPSEVLSNKIQAVAPGLEGGDSLLAEAVLHNSCDTVVCLHDPDTMAPHTLDSEMLERTCQLSHVSTVCLTSLSSASAWARGLRRELGSEPAVPLAERLRKEFGLTEAVIVECEDDEDSDELGHALSRVAAGYVHAAVSRLASRGGGRIAVSWGWAMKEMVAALYAMEDQGLLPRPVGNADLRWSATMGDLASLPGLDAGEIAVSLCRFFGGSTEHLDSLGFAPDGHILSRQDRDQIAQMALADLVLVSAAPWNERSGLYLRSGWRPGYVFPSFDAACGTIGGVFLDETGAEVTSQWRLIGMDHASLAEAASKEAVVLIAGGRHRRPVIRAALQANLVSVLITSSHTAEWLLAEAGSEPSPSRMESLRGAASPPAVKPRAHPGRTLVEEWFGEVVAVPDDVSFVAHLRDAAEEKRDRQARFRRSQVKTNERDRLVPGAQFVWRLFVSSTDDGEEWSSQLSLVPPEPLTQSEVDSALTEADEILRILDG